MLSTSVIKRHGILGKLFRPQTRQIFQDIYNNVLLTSGDVPNKSILICAANPNEGSTTVALGLAMAAAEQDTEPVLLIDGDFHNPQVCEVFGQGELYGLGDLMAGRLELSSVIMRTVIPDLWVMGAGVIPPNHLFNLESQKFRGLLDRLAGQYKLVVIDGPAVNAFPESVLYASQTDRVFMVVHAGKTRVQVVNTALARLFSGGRKKVDMVLNRREFPIPPWIYRRL